ncbi:MAG: hypothetical protein RJA63_2327 [Pseudomonadota bacterium]|jgi:hypothetical protein|nr:hypothetical protein [Alicycliphilus sp.]
MNFRSIALITLIGAALAAPVLAQPGSGMGGGWGGAPCMQGGGMRNGAGMGPGARAGWGNKGGRMMMANQDNVRGWSLLTPEERTSFQNRMRNVETYDECIQVQTEHRGMVEVRAKEKGVNLMTPMRNMCDNLKARGAIQ